MDVRSVTHISCQIERFGSDFHADGQSGQWSGAAFSERVWLEGGTDHPGIRKLVYIGVRTGDWSKFEFHKRPKVEEEILRVSQGWLDTRENLNEAFDNAAFHFLILLEQAAFDRFFRYVYAYPNNVDTLRFNFTVRFLGEQKDVSSISLDEVDFTSRREALITRWGMSRFFEGGDRYARFSDS